MGATARRAAAEIEEGETLFCRSLDEGPIEQHVRSDGVVRLECRGPGHLELAVPAQPTPSGDGASAVVRTPEPHVGRERLGERFEQPFWLSRRAEVSHVLRKHSEERANLIEAKPDG